MFELRRDPVTGWWSAIVTDRAFEHASFAMEAAPIEGTHCRHCDDSPADDDDAVRRVVLRPDAFEIVPPGRDWNPQVEMLPEEAPDKRGRGRSWSGRATITSGSPMPARTWPRSCCATCATRCASWGPPPSRRTSRSTSRSSRTTACRPARGRQHLNFELYAIPQVPHRVAEEIGGGARHMISRQSCAWCAMASAEEENGTRLVLADERFVVLAPAASRSAVRAVGHPARARGGLHPGWTTRRWARAGPRCSGRSARSGVLGDPPYNLFLHTAPAGERLDQTFHWHWELHPRLRVIAGLERATALAVNPAAPEYAAEVLRDHLAVGRPLTGRAGGIGILTVHSAVPL